MKNRLRRETTILSNKISSSNQTPSTSNLSPIFNLNVIHRPNCRLYQQTLSSTPSSISPYFLNAPVASPELSDIADLTNPSSPMIELRPISHISSMNNSVESAPSPIILSNRLKPNPTDIIERICSDMNTIPSAKNIVENLLIGTMNKKLNVQFCECYNQDDISRDDDNNDNVDDIDENKTKKTKSKLSLLFERYCLSYITKFRRLISRFVASKHFRLIVLSAIVINTLSMGIEYHGQPESLTNALEYSNLVFTSLFAVEMVLKIFADGCLKYIKNGYNLFDGGIVIMSIVELHGQKNSGLSVLRTFRLLRVLKLVRFMPTLRRQLVGRFFD